MTLQSLGMKPIPLPSGCNTRTEPQSLPFGSASMMLNLDPLFDTVSGRVALKKRAGVAALHSTADGTNEVVTLFQYNKAKVSESHFFAQMSDGDVLEATNAPPTVTTGAFGSEAFSGTGSGEIPASWSVVDDLLLYSNGADQHQVYGGTSSYVDAFVVYKGAGTMPTIPDQGEDYSIEAAGGDGNAILDSFGSDSDHRILVRTPVPVNSLSFTIAAANGNASVMTLYYKKSDGTWADASATDNTASGGATLAQTGTVTWTLPSDEISSFCYGACGFWYAIKVSAALDAEVEVSGVTWSSVWQALRNVWDGSVLNTAEVQVETGSGTGIYGVNPGTSVDLDELPSGSDIMIACPYPVEGFYVEVGTNPNTAATTINTTSGVAYWDGSAFQNATNITDETSGFSNSGWITFPRKAAQPHQFNSSVYAYWYRITISTADVSANTKVAIYCMPYFDINDYGKGRCNCEWQGRAVYSFTEWPDYVFVTPIGKPLCLNGPYFRRVHVGTGAANKITAIVPFHNELLVFQEEASGRAGVTAVEILGDGTVSTRVISPDIGTFSAKSVCVVDGVEVSTNTEESIKTLCFFNSTRGACITDGLTVTVASDDIQNHWDPQESECIRRGYGDKMWTGYDPSIRAVVFGLVSGASASKCNVYAAFCLISKRWRFRDWAQEFSCFANVKAQSGNIFDVQVAGGTADGTVYRINTGANDVSTAIDAYVTIELGSGGSQIKVGDFVVRCKVQAAGNITATFYKNGVSKFTRTLPMTALATNETIRNNRKYIGYSGEHLSVKLQNATASVSMTILDLMAQIFVWGGW